MLALLITLSLTTAHGADALAPQAIAEAEWARDVDTLLAGPFEPGDLPRVAIALGRTRDPAVLDRLALLARQSERTVRAAAAVALGWVPGSAPTLRARLAEELDPALRAALLRGLGAQGDAGDRALLETALLRPAPEGVAAAEAIGLLARRGVDVAASALAVIAALDALDARRVAAAAFAVQRLAPVGLSAVERATIERAYARSGSEGTRAMLLPTLLASLPASEHRAWQLAVLADPYRAAKAALLAVSTGEAWSSAELQRLVDDPDPWLRQLARERLTPTPVPAPGERLAVALDRGAPAARTRAAAAWIAEADGVEAIAALLPAEDPAVRELAAEALARRTEPAAFAHLAALVRDEAALAPLVPALDGLLAGVTAGRRLEPAVAARVRALAADGPFGVRERAWRVARAAGLAPGPRTPVLPGPVGIARDLDAIGAIRSARVETTEGTFRIALEPEVAPLAVATFAWLAEHGALDELAFHRVVPGFVVQTGDPRGDGSGGPDWILPDEVSDAPFVAGAVGMATSGPDRGGSQWFVTTTPQPHLAGAYTRFGVVSDGLDLVRRLDRDDRVLHVVIERVEVGP